MNLNFIYGNGVEPKGVGNSFVVHGMNKVMIKFTRVAVVKGHVYVGFPRAVKLVEQVNLSRSCI